MKSKTEVVPKLRFPEFRDAGEWEVKQLGDSDVSTFVNERVALNDINIINYVSTENILPDFAGIKPSSSLPSSGSFTKYREQDILIANIRPYLKKVWVSNRSGAASNDVIVIRPSSQVNASYLSYLVKNDNFIAYVMKGAKGVKMPRGDIALMKQYPVSIPFLLTEQQKIADCLSSLDEVIDLHTKKLEALKAHKKGLMQQLFPQEGETTPRLRFPEFRDVGEWEVKRIHELLDYERPEPYIVQSDNYEPYGTPVLTANKSFILGYTYEQTGIYEDVPVIIFDDFTTDKKFVDFPFKVKSSAIKILKRKGENNIRFIFELMNLIHFDPQQHKRYYISEYQNIVVRVPIPKEQQKIADFLLSIDEVIELHTKKLEALKAHKKGLMQQLFPQEVG